MQSLQFNFEAIGTTWVIDIFDVSRKIDQQNIITAVTKRIAEFDRIYSRFNAESLINTIARKKGIYTFPEDARPLFSLYHKLYRITDGLLTPLIGQTMEDAGYDKNYSLKEKTLHHPPSWEETMTYNHPTLTVKSPVLLDFGAAGKGYLIDLIAKMFLDMNLSSFCIDAGGDMIYKNPKKKLLRVGLEHPENTNQVIGVASIHNQAICGSASNRRKWGKFHHLINPKTLVSPQNILASWVIADATSTADALATALFFAKPQILQKHFTFEYLILFHDYTIEKSFAFPATLFYNEEN